ncbi:MAG: HAD family hydrolase [Alphaproteobacteria bacterium]|nr:MAG: HAD family hydrolase [Alphaproteobacteria bacterium]
MSAELTAPKALIFDWDDTITNNWWRVLLSMNKTLTKLGHPEWTEDEALRRLGPSARDLFPAVFGQERAQEASDLYYSFIDELKGEGPRICDGAVEAVKALAETPLYLAVLSNKRADALRAEVALVGLSDCFSCIVGAGDAAEDKPGRAAVEKALEASKGLQPGPDVWFVGDSHIDMQCAHFNGLTAVLVETKPPPEEMLENFYPHLRFAGCKDLSSHIFKTFFQDFDLPFLQSRCT